MYALGKNMHRQAKMNGNLTVRIDDETADALREIKATTGTGAAHLVRIGLQKTIAQFKRDGFLKIEATPEQKGQQS